MDQPNSNTSQNAEPIDNNTLILSALNANALANLPPEVELATVRHMMQALFAKVESLQQNQAVQLAGVHDRLDAVELELPLIQEQGALRLRDLEVRMTAGIDEAARSAVEEATSAATAAATAALHEEVAGKFNSLAAHMEAQRHELTQMRESKRIADSRLNRAILDIERLCGNLPNPVEDHHRPRIETPSPYRSRISEHIRKAAIDLAPGEENPLIGHPAAASRPALTTPASAIEKQVSASPAVTRAHAEAPATAINTPPGPAPHLKLEAQPAAAPGFDAWKRQFMQHGEPNVPTLTPELESGHSSITCPRCFSERTRPSTLNRLDRFYRLAGFSPHRCRSCAHRFYKRVGAALIAPDGEPSEPRAPEAMETR